MSDISKASLPKAIFLMGPTASGKTALAIELRKILPVELISVDSALIYKGMDIGTAKPNAEELLAAPHRLLDIRDPSQAYSAADFRRYRRQTRKYGPELSNRRQSKVGSHCIVNFRR